MSQKCDTRKSNDTTMTDETKTNTCPIDPECTIGADGIHSKYHLAPRANATVLGRRNRCAFCGLDVDKCNDRVTMTNAETGEVIATNMKMSNGYLPPERKEDARP